MSALDAAVAYRTNRDQRTRAMTVQTDVWTVTGIDDDGRILARPTITSGEGTRTPAIDGVRCQEGDEVIVQKVGGRWIITGALTGQAGGAVLIHGEPIIVPPFVRDSDGASNTWGTPNATVDFSSLRTTVNDLDPATTYLVSADAGAYLTSASSGVKVRMGVRIGYASDPDSFGDFGAGHRSTSPQWTRAFHERVVSGVASIQVTGRATASAVGSHTIGDADLNIRIVPLILTGRF